MKSILHLKFLLLYAIFGFLSIFTIATLSYELITQNLISNASRSLSRETTLVASNFMPVFYNTDNASWMVQQQLNTMANYFDATMWFVEPDGTIILAAGRAANLAPTQIKNFNPAEMGANHFIRGDYHGYFSEEMITTIAPITLRLSIRGYLISHRSITSIVDARQQQMIYIAISALMVYLFSFIILFGFQFFVYRPLRKITEAATQYAKGNLEYEIPVNANDEMGHLSASLNYMSNQLKDSKEYQKKIVTNVSHDFRTPLTSIRGYVVAMRDGTIPPELYEKYLGIIQFETERLTDLTTDLLTLNEFDRSELHLNKIPFDIQRTIRQVVATFEGVCREKRISFDLMLLPKPEVVYADHSKIQQVLYNLIENAIKFSGVDATISIEVREKGEKVYVSVKDYGIGIPKKDLNKIWDRFYKSDLSRGKDKKGTGLGLSIVKETMNAHDEYINVISTEGVGTEFTFSLSKAPV